MKSHIAKIYADLKGYNFDRFKKDLNAGVITGIIAIPLSLALAIATGVEPILGLYTAIIAGFIAAAFAGSRFSVSGPAAAMVPILAAIIVEYGKESLPLIGVMAGIFLILFGIMRVGQFIKYVPLSVTLGFTAGIAITLFFGQLNSFLGLTGIHSEEMFHEKTLQTFEHLFTVNWATLLIGILSLAILILLPKIKALKSVPPSLVAVVVCSLIVYFLPQYFGNVKTIADAYGAIQLGFPPFKLVMPSSFNQILDLSIPALKVAFLISIESLMCAVVADKMSKTRHLSNQELISQGIANVIAPFFSAIPSTAVIARTGTSIKNGAASRFAAMIHALVVLLFVLFLAPYGGEIPLTVLSTILFITAWKISEQEEIRKLIKLSPKSDIAILFMTLLLTVFTDLIVAVGFGMFVAILFIFNRLSTIYGENITSKKRFIDSGLRDMLENHPEIQFINLEGNLSMGAAGSLLDRIHIHEHSSILIFRMREIHHVDLSGLEALKELVSDLQHEGKKVYFTSINTRVRHKLEKFGMIESIDGIYESTNAIVLSMK